LSFEWHDLDFNSGYFMRLGSYARMWYDVSVSSTLRHVFLPFPYRLEAPLTVHLPDPNDNTIFELAMTASKRDGKLSFVQARDLGSGTRQTTFLRPERRLKSWKWGRVAAAIAFVAANKGHTFVDSGVVAQAGLIQMIGEFHGGDYIADFADRFELQCPEVKEHSQHVEAEKKKFYPRVAKIVLDSRYGQACTTSLHHQYKRIVWTTPKVPVVDDNDDDDDVQILDAPPSSSSRPRLPGPSRKNKRKDGPQ
jgi:hypothetical protein